MNTTAQAQKDALLDCARRAGVPASEICDFEKWDGIATLRVYQRNWVIGNGPPDTLDAEHHRAISEGKYTVDVGDDQVSLTLPKDVGNAFARFLTAAGVPYENGPGYMDPTEAPVP